MEGDLRPTGDLDGHNSRKLQKEQTERKGRGQNAHPFGQIESSNQIDARSGTDLVEIGVREDGELLLDGLEQPHRDVQPRVGAVSQFRRVLHRTEGTAGPRRDVERPRGVPPVRSDGKP